MSVLKSLRRALPGVRLAAVIALAGAAFAPAWSADKTYGKPGEPIKLTIGYQPYYTESWSGIVMRGKKLYEKYLPKGSEVEFAVGLQGAVIVNAMLAGKQDIGYVGDMPGIVSTTKQEVADIRIVATAGVGTDMCNIVLARMDAPAFQNPKEALKWLGGKKISIPLGSCADRFAQAALKKEGVVPEATLNQNIEVITSGFRAGKVDAAVLWEPTASRLVQEGLAKRVASGDSVGEYDAAFLTMRADLIKQRPDIVKAWLNAELDAQLFLADEKNAMEVAAMAGTQSTGFSEKMLWASMYNKYAPASGGAATRLTLPYTITPDVTKMIENAATFLFSIKSINVEKLRPEAVMPEFTQAILKERNLTSPIGKVAGMDEKEYKGKP
jgi:NitT/TauT family transport system substrate-binding protein